MGKKKAKKAADHSDIDDIEEEDYDSDQRPKRKAKKPAKKPASARKSQVQDTPKRGGGKKAKPEAKKPSTKKHDEEEEKEDKKKNYLPGQKYPTPEEEDGARAFYTSLYSQNPESQMAKRFCLDYGLLQKNEATKVMKEVNKKR